MPAPVSDKSGLRFGRLRVVRLVGRNKWGAALWECQCDCGSVGTYPSTRLNSNRNKSCGCVTGSKPGSIKRTAIERFLEKVDKTGECWRWIGARMPSGYGNFWLGPERGIIGAHQAALLLFRGVAVQKGFEACHVCDNPWCVNPDHLFVGTRLDNMRDAKSKGRLKRNKAA